MHINARNLAAALQSLGADVESALLELAAVAPSLDAKVRRALFHDEVAGKLRLVTDRGNVQLLFMAPPPCPRWACVMHAVDQVTQFLDDSDVVTYLKQKFPDHDYTTIWEHK